MMEPGSIMWKCEQYDVLKVQLTALAQQANELEHQRNKAIAQVESLRVQLTAMTERAEKAEALVLMMGAGMTEGLEEQLEKSQQEIERLTEANNRLKQIIEEYAS